MRSIVAVVCLVGVICSAGCGEKSFPTQPDGGTLLNPSSGSPVVTFRASATSVGVLRVDAVSGTMTVLASGGDFSEPSGVVFAPNGDLYVVDEDAFLTKTGKGGAIFCISSATGECTTVFRDSCFSTPLALAVAPSGDIYFTCFIEDSHRHGLVRLSPTTGAVSVLASGLGVGWYGVAIGTSGVVYATVNNYPESSGGVLRVNPSSGAVDTVTWGGSLTSPAGLALDAAGNLIVTNIPDPSNANSPGQVFRVNAVTGVQALLSAGKDLWEPYGVAVARNGDILVYDGGKGSDAFGGHIVRIDSTTGAQTVLAPIGLGGPPSGIALTPLSFRQGLGNPY
jgi:streptogramin lyase